jgi:uncharacterized protein YjbI with pentapeptide repeats
MRSRSRIKLPFHKDISKAWKLSIFILVFVSIFLACDFPAADPNDLKAQDLSGQDFSQLTIRDFDLSEKNLQNTSFRYSTVSGTNFTDADLRGASFEWAMISRANFTRADMRGVNLDGTCFFQDAIWTGAILDHKWEKILGLFKDRQLINQDLQGYDLSKVCFQSVVARIDWGGTDFSDANLENAVFNPGARDLENSNFRNANLHSAALTLADLTNADFTNAILTNTYLDDANLTGAKISTEQLSQAILSSCTRLPNGLLVDEQDCNSID